MGLLNSGDVSVAAFWVAAERWRLWISETLTRCVAWLCDLRFLSQNPKRGRAVL